ncbi:MAG: DUF2357 domain-containing protein [Candidatus Izemoplasmataceae bacterium]
MTKATNEAKEYQKKLSESIMAVEESTVFPSHFFQAFYEGKRTIFQKDFTHIKQFDEKWVRAIEKYYQNLNRITRKLKSTLRYEEEILPVEKTKRIDPRTIRHLSSHTENIRNIDDEGEIVPSKLLSAQSEIEYGIYENRFIMTLINRLERFIRERLNLIKKDLKGERKTHLQYDSAFSFNESDYEMTINLKQKQIIDKQNINEHNQYIYDRASNLHKLVTNLKNSEFMRIMKPYKEVSAPIMKTQIILKNPDYKNAYLLWIFLDKYYKLDYELDTKTIHKRFSPSYQKQIDQSMMAMFSTFFSNDASNAYKKKDKKAQYKTIQAKNIPVDEASIELNPFALTVEPYVANELYIQKMQKMFDKAYTRSIREKPTTTLGLKSVLTNMLKVTNDLYASFFEINHEQDLFEQLLKEEDPEKRLDEAYDKHKIAKIIREVKEKDYKEAIRLERQWHNTLHDYQSALLKLEKQKQTEQLKARIDKIQEKSLKEIDARKRQTLKNKEIQTRKYKKSLDTYTKKLQATLKSTKQKLRKEEAEKLEKARQRIKDTQARKFQKEKERIEKHQEKLRLQLKRKKAALKQKKDAQIKAAKARSLKKVANRIQKEKTRLDTQTSKAVERLNSKSKELKNELKSVNDQLKTQ